MTIHKLFKEFEKLSEEQIELLFEARRERKNCQRLCDELNVKYSDKRFARFIYERSKNNNGVKMAQPVNQPRAPFTLKQIEQVVLGTNLDIIEEAAEKKGLI